MNHVVSAGLRTPRGLWCGAVLVPLVAGLLASGCGQRTIQLEGTSEDSGKVLVEMLDSWKSGKAVADFQTSRQPPLVVGDEDWSAGAELKSYEVGPPVQNGGHWRVPASLVVATKDRGELKRTVAYAVTLKPTVSIIRADDTEFE